MSSDEDNLDARPHNPIRAQNLALAAAAVNPSEGDSPRLDDVSSLSDTFFNFSTGRLQIHLDEAQIMLLGDYTGRVVEWFEGLMRPPPPMASGIPNVQDTVFTHCNQITTLRPVREFLLESKTFKLGKNNGTVKRLQRVLDMQANVVKAHETCVSKVRQTLSALPIIGNRNACFAGLQKALNEAAASGLFLRRYRNDITDDALETDAQYDVATRGRLIDFRNSQQRADYLNTEVSIFVEDELMIAEMYFHTLLSQQHLENRAAHQSRLNSTPPSSPVERARAANHSRPVSDYFPNSYRRDFMGNGMHGEYVFPTETGNAFPLPEIPQFPRVASAASAVATGSKALYKSIQNFTNKPVGELVGLTSPGHVSPASVSSSRSSSSGSSYGSAKSSRSRSTSSAVTASSRAASNGNRSMRRRVHSHEPKKSSRFTLKPRAKSH
jgi:hypothetical protein